MSVASLSHALQLGKHRGAAIIGQPLNIAIQAVADSPEELAPGCVDADVFYSDSRIEKSRVRVTTEKPITARQDFTIRVRTTLAIDEPVVTIYLRTGCLQKIEKRYVVLAEMLSESAAGSGLSLPALPPAPALTRNATGGSTSEVLPSKSSPAASSREARRAQRQAQLAEQKAAAASGDVASPAVEIRDPAQRVTRPVDTASVLPGAKPEKNRTASVAKPDAAEKTKARLKLEPLELLAERDPALKSSALLLTAPTSDPAQRSAAAALWRAIAAQPEDILSDSQKVKALESAVSGLQLQMKKNQLDMQDLGGNVQKAQTEKYANPLVYTLGLILLLALLGLAMLLKKRRFMSAAGAPVDPWWRKGSGQRVGWADSAEAIRSPVSSMGGLEVKEGEASDGHAKEEPSNLDLDLSDTVGRPPRSFSAKNRPDASVFRSSFGGNMRGDHTVPAQNLKANFLQSAGMAGRSVKAEELFDVQQQADFFVSLGQKDQAVEVLRMHIEESEKTSALVYLDLLKLYHEQGEHFEFEAFRQEFNAKFNAEMPAFDGYGAAVTSEGLQAYPVAMSRIVALWPSAKVLAVLEESMFREPDSQTPTFDLEAYRELLLLYAMMKDMLQSQTQGKGPNSVPSTQRSPVDRQSHPGRAGTAHDADSADNDGTTFSTTFVVPLAATLEGEPLAAELDFNLQESLDVDLTGSDRHFGGEDGAAGSVAQTHAADVKGTQNLSADTPGLVATPAQSSPSPENLIDFDFDAPASVSLISKKADRLPGKKD